MISMIQMQGTLFLYILIGIYAQKKGIITGLNRKKFTDFIIEIILPCNIVNSFLIPWSNEILMNCLTVLIVAIITQVLYVLLSKVLFCKTVNDRQAVLRYAIICSNAGFLGNPIVESVFGGQGLLFASVALIPLRFAMWSSGLSLFTKTDGKSSICRFLPHGYANTASRLSIKIYVRNRKQQYSNIHDCHWFYTGRNPYQGYP